ncbi:MAG TPA: hypothetical protein VGA88_02525 [Burkholderiales bacterium]
MAIGTTVFLRGQHTLGSAGLRAGRQRLVRSDWSHVLAISASAIPAVLLAVQVWQWAGAWWAALPLLAKFGAGIGQKRA